MSDLKRIFDRIGKLDYIIRSKNLASKEEHILALYTIVVQDFLDLHDFYLDAGWRPDHAGDRIDFDDLCVEIKLLSFVLTCPIHPEDAEGGQVLFKNLKHPEEIRELAESIPGAFFYDD